MWVDYPELQCDLSSFSQPDNEYMVNVTAVVGLEESPAAPPDGLVFSYYQNSVDTLKCECSKRPSHCSDRAPLRMITLVNILASRAGRLWPRSPIPM